MKMTRHTLHTVGSGALTLAALGLVVLVIFWPSPVAQALCSRLAVFFIAIWCGGFALFLHPELCARLRHFIREFREATDDVTRQILGDDDDDGPRAA
jgi:hypothetical protein